MTAAQEPIITTSNFLSSADALDWYQKNIDSDCTALDIQDKINEDAISITQPKQKARYNLTAPHGRWQYELDEFWKCLKVFASDIEIKPELLQSAWYDYVEPFGKATHIDYKQYVFVRVSYFYSAEGFQIDFFTEKMHDGPCICIHSTTTDKDQLKINKGLIKLDF